MYTNMTKTDTMDVITTILKIKSLINESVQNEIIHKKTVMEQKYFKFKQKYYKQTD
jgi:hypothetical protein